MPERVERRPGLTDAERLAISAVVHQNYYMPDVFAAVERILAERRSMVGEATLTADERRRYASPANTFPYNQLVYSLTNVEALLSARRTAAPAESANPDARLAALIADAQRVVRQIKDGTCRCADERHQNLLHDLATDLAALGDPS